MGHVQDTPVLTKMILNECMMYHMKVHIFSYNLGPQKFSKSRICILSNYGQTDSKTAIVGPWEARLFFTWANFKVKFPYLKPTAHSKIVLL